MVQLTVLSHRVAVLGVADVSKIGSQKVLVVGAGGIGYAPTRRVSLALRDLICLVFVFRCELLKNLVLSGFKDIEVHFHVAASILCGTTYTRHNSHVHHFRHPSTIVR
jgi:hypothetical protein